MEDSQQTIPPHDEPAATPAGRPRPSWYLRWGKASALWLCGFAVGGAAVYGAIWGKEQYDGYQTLQALNLPAPDPVPPKDDAVVKLFAPEEAPKEALAVAPAPAPEPARVNKPVRAKPARTRPVNLAKAPVRKPVVSARQQARLGERRAAPRILEIRRANVAGELRRPCRRGDLARECYVAR